MYNRIICGLGRGFGLKASTTTSGTFPSSHDETFTQKIRNFSETVARDKLNENILENQTHTFRPNCENLFSKRSLRIGNVYYYGSNTRARSGMDFYLSSIVLAGSLLGVGRTLLSYHRDYFREHTLHYVLPMNNHKKCAYTKAKSICDHAIKTSAETTIKTVNAAPVKQEDDDVLVFPLHSGSQKSVRIVVPEKIDSDQKKSTEFSFNNAFDISAEDLDEFTNVSKACSGASFNIMGLKSLKEGNHKRALMYFQEGSMVGHAKSQYNLALCYERGVGTIKNIAKAKKLYAQAAYHGHAQSQYNFATHLMKSGEIAQVLEALYLLELAAESGLLQAQSYLGEFLTMSGPHQDLPKAVKMLELASAQGDSMSIYHLGVCYENGFGGCKHDAEKAYQFYRLSASKGNVPAHYNMAVLLENGKAGVEYNLAKIKLLYKFASSRGHRPSRDRLAHLEARERNINTIASKFKRNQTSPLINDLLEENVQNNDEIKIDNDKNRPTFFIGSDFETQNILQGKDNISTIQCLQNSSKVPALSLKSCSSYNMFNTKPMLSNNINMTCVLLHHNVSSPASLSTM